jgi:hypothetical protein
MRSLLQFNVLIHPHGSKQIEKLVWNVYQGQFPPGIL